MLNPTAGQARRVIPTWVGVAMIGCALATVSAARAEPLTYAQALALALASSDAPIIRAGSLGVEAAESSVEAPDACRTRGSSSASTVFRSRDLLPVASMESR